MDAKSKFVSVQHRRIRNLIVLCIAVALLWWWVDWQDRNLIRSSFNTGYAMLGVLLFLTAFNLRKRLTFLPSIGSAAFWMQLHIYVGLFSFFLFGFHVAWRIPNGVFERILAALYFLVAGSGVYGLYLTRFMPKRLTSLKDEVIYERIPALKNALAGKAKELTMQARQVSEVLARFYVNRLAQFFECPRSFAYQLHPNMRERKKLISEIQELDRYLGNEYRSVSQEIQQLVCEKDDLDYHHVVQGRLKGWLFLHIGLTYGLLLYAMVHGLMAHSFGGGMP